MEEFQRLFEFLVKAFCLYIPLILGMALFLKFAVADLIESLEVTVNKKTMPIRFKVDYLTCVSFLWFVSIISTFVIGLYRISSMF